MHKARGIHRAGGKVILCLLILALIVFTATRTLHFLQMTFSPELQYVSYLGLAAFDIGILGWLYYAMHSAEGVNQRTVAYGMIFVCMAGVCVTTVADMVIESSKNGLTKLPPQWGTIGLWGVIIVIVINIVCGVVVHLVDPKHSRHMAMEDARDKIHAITLAEISRQADIVAPQIARDVATHWGHQMIQEMTGSIPGSYKVPPTQLPSGKVVSADPLPAKAASRDHVVDPHNVREEVKKEKEKEPLFNFALPILSKKEDEEKEGKIDEEEIPTEQQTETDLMSMPIDQRWQEYSNINNAESSKQPQKKRRRKKAEAEVEAGQED